MSPTVSKWPLSGMGTGVPGSVVPAIETPGVNNETTPATQTTRVTTPTHFIDPPPRNHDYEQPYPTPRRPSTTYPASIHPTASAIRPSPLRCQPQVPWWKRADEVD